MINTTPPTRMDKEETNRSTCGMAELADPAFGVAALLAVVGVLAYMVLHPEEFLRCRGWERGGQLWCPEDERDWEGRSFSDALSEEATRMGFRDNPNLSVQDVIDGWEEWKTIIDTIDQED